MLSPQPTEDGHDDLVVDAPVPAGSAELDAPTVVHEFSAIVARSYARSTAPDAGAAPIDGVDLTYVPPARPARLPLRHRFDRHRRAAARAAQGEVRLAHQLARLPAGWHVLHPVPVGLRASDQVHVLVGPAGVFTLDVLHHPRSNVWTNGETLWVDGHRSHELASSRFAAARATDVLTAALGTDVVVRPLVVLAGTGLAKAGEPVGVEIVYLEMLVRTLKAMPHVLGPAEVDAVVDRARRSTTWTR